MSSATRLGLFARWSPTLKPRASAHVLFFHLDGPTSFGNDTSRAGMGVQPHKPRQVVGRDISNPVREKAYLC